MNNTNKYFDDPNYNVVEKQVDFLENFLRNYQINDSNLDLQNYLKKLKIIDYSLKRQKKIHDEHKPFDDYLNSFEK